MEVRFGISSKFGSFAFVPKIDEVCFRHILLVFLHKIIPDYMQKERIIGSKSSLLPKLRSWKSVRFATEL